MNQSRMTTTYIPQASVSSIQGRTEHWITTALPLQKMRTSTTAITRLTVLLAAALLATACVSNSPRTDLTSEPEAVAVADTQEASVEEEVARYSRRYGCPNGYAPTGTRIKRCTRHTTSDVRVVDPSALDNVGYGSESQATGRSSGGPPQD